MAGPAEAAAARGEALRALLAARRVTEKGIDAFPEGTVLEALPEPQAAGAAAIASWREIEVRCNYWGVTCFHHGDRAQRGFPYL